MRLHHFPDIMIGLEHWLPMMLLMAPVWSLVTDFEHDSSSREETDVDLAVLSSLLMV